MTATLTSVAYAKNPDHERFIQGFTGQCRGRYHLAYLVGVEILSGPALRAEIERDLGQPRYLPDQMYPSRDLAVIFDRAVRAGLSAERLGELVIPTYKRVNPHAFEGRSVADGFEILERGWRTETTYGGVSPAHEVEPGRVKIFRVGQPTPCAFFVGVIHGLFKAFGVEGSAAETTCQWEGAQSCCFEARWEHPKTV